MIAAHQPRASSLSSIPSWGKQSLSTLSNRLNAFVSKTLNGTARGGTCYEDVSLSSFGMNERSQSRGRDVFASTGRGGVGNIRPTSLSRPADSSPTPELIRGREPNADLPTANKLYSTGRGGAGNIRSPSRSQNRDPSQPPTLPAVEEDIMRNHRYMTEEAPIYTGRGGVGNINSRSRSRGPGLDLSAPNSTPTTPHKVSLLKDPTFNDSPARSASGQNDDDTIVEETSAPSTAAGNNPFTYPPTSYQAAGRARED